MDQFTEKGFEIYGDDGGYVNFQLMPDGSLEICLSDGDAWEYRNGRMETRADEILIPPDRVPDILVGIQAWIEQIKEAP